MPTRPPSLPGPNPVAGGPNLIALKLPFAASIALAIGVYQRPARCELEIKMAGNAAGDGNRNPSRADSFSPYKSVA